MHVVTPRSGLPLPRSVSIVVLNAKFEIERKEIYYDDYKTYNLIIMI